MHRCDCTPVAALQRDYSFGKKAREVGLNVPSQLSLVLTSFVWKNTMTATNI